VLLLVSDPVSTAEPETAAPGVPISVVLDETPPYTPGVVVVVLYPGVVAEVDPETDDDPVVP